MKQPTPMGMLAEAHPKSRSRRLSRIIGGGRPHTIIVRRDKDVPWGAKIESIDIIERKVRYFSIVEGLDDLTCPARSSHSKERRRSLHHKLNLRDCVGETVAQASGSC